ncbi:MAG: hypothetical protein PHG02_10230 [Oscillospiraceae bacterium]|nr:hypothetical protein [Oscillospiraceae bacterium]
MRQTAAVCGFAKEPAIAAVVLDCDKMTVENSLCIQQLSLFTVLLFVRLDGITL